MTYALVAGPLRKKPYRPATGTSWVQWVAAENMSGTGTQTNHPRIITFFRSKWSARKPPGIMVKAVLRVIMEKRKPTSAEVAGRLLM